MTDFVVMRTNMIEGQIRPNEVTDPQLIAALSIIPREPFVSKRFQAIAYRDEEVEMFPDRYLMEPRVFARLIQGLAAKPAEVGLCIGCGTGYGVAILAQLCGTVIGLESEKELYVRAGDLLSLYEIDNALVVQGTLKEGYLEQGPYDLIFIEGAIPQAPTIILDQLADGGRLAAVIKNGQNSSGEATIFTKIGNSVGRSVLFDAATEMLPGFEVLPDFTFY